MTQAVAPSTDAQNTVASELFASPGVTGAIDTLVDEVRAASGKITGVRGPIEGRKADYDAYLETVTGLRGRPLFYRYIGSGAGNGIYVELDDGSVKMDLIGGIGYTPFGHAHPELVRAAVTGAIEDNLKHGQLQSTKAAHEFGRTLVKYASRSSRLEHVFISAGGALANENAIKICYQKHAPASRVIAFKHCFMGRTVTMSQIGDSAGNRQGIPLSTQIDYMGFWNDEAAAKVGGKDAFIDHECWRLKELFTRYPRQHACFIFEIVQGEGGFTTAPREFYVRLMEMCKEHGVAVWADEVQSFGRTEQMFAFEHFDLGEYVDVVTVGKSTQACATLYTADYNPKAGLLSGTFMGATPEFTAGKRALEMMESTGLYGDDGLAARHHKAFLAQVEALKAKHPDWFPEVPFVTGHAGGIGGMMRFTPFGGEKAKIGKLCKVLFDEGMIAFYNGHGPFHVRFLPPLGCMKLEDWAGAFEIVERALAKVAAG
jgi:4-aminobutyrate aminotransferase-like enzyme